MSFVKKEYSEIFLDGLNNAFEKHLISNNDKFIEYIENKEDIENFYVMLLSVHAEWIAKIYDNLQLIYDSTFLDRANGVDLDKLGALVGVPRSAGTRSYIDVLFELTNNTDTEQVIPKGTLLKTRNGANFETSKTVTLPVGAYNIIAPAYSTEMGADSHAAAGEMSLISAGLSGFRVRNEHVSSGGLSVMSDDEYREYLRNWSNIQERGTEWAYRQYFRNVDGVDSYHLIPRWDGAGTLKIVLDLNENNGDDVLGTVYDELMEHVALFDDDIYLCTAKPHEVNIFCSVNVDYDSVNQYSDSFKEELRLRLEDLIKTYINGGMVNGTYHKGMSIGEDFIPHKLAVWLDGKIPELKNIVFNYPCEPLVLGDEEICQASEINITME